MNSLSNRLKNFILYTILIWILSLIMIACSNRHVDNSQPNKLNSRTQQEILQSDISTLDSSKAYCRAIVEYIKAVSENKAPNFDTLFIGNPDLLPKIKLPATIQGKRIILLSDDIARKNPQNNKSFILINICWAAFEKNPIEFMFITFYNDKKHKSTGFHPQHQSYIYLKYYPDKKEFILDKEVRFEYGNSEIK